MSWSQGSPGGTLDQYGSYGLSESDRYARRFVYEMDGHYGGLTRIKLMPEELDISCDCPYPGTGCRNGVAEAPNVRDLPALPLKMDLYPFQKKDVQFGLYKTGVLTGDETGMGKTLQAIGLCVLKKEIFGFSNE